ncbi:hypothetical protein L227DRAFT_30377 [Lentinus tigrinus ALCF2SS1-6]|uniref:Fungal N-terminal domain-containing protein n=1 Tax=Lentinus tigrinus ALCF2SS1-6 TaxID=1328759 RepID=A0A5C2SF08_9APHY|nr:hypothetical protein L227DRAFT_30377 [Lentinus tigrinus ALCF2SS1-6]
MPFPISFSSFGDIVTAVDLALRISKALSASTGSSYEYQYLIQELDALAHVLQLADTATRTGMLQPDVVRALVSEIGRCRTVMDALWERIRGYQKALGGSSKTSGKISGSSWRKIGWALFKTQDVQETRMKLATHRANLTTLMTACNLYGVRAHVRRWHRSNTRRIPRSNIDELKTQCVRFEKTMHSRLSELYNIISQLPYRLGHTNDNAITFVDWRGIETILPLHLVNHNRDQLHALLGALSLQWPGHARWRCCREYRATWRSSDQEQEFAWYICVSAINCPRRSANPLVEESDLIQSLRYVLTATQGTCHWSLLWHRSMNHAPCAG